MKKISAIMITGFFLFSSAIAVQAQPAEAPAVTAIAPYPLTIASTKTTNIIFPYAIISVDIGSREVLAQKAKGVENILQVKAAHEGFAQTNLSVVTADGKLTSFLVDFVEQPAILNLSLSASNEPSTAIHSSESVNEQRLALDAQSVFEAKKSGNKQSDRAFGVRLQLNGVFIRDQVMFLRFNAENRTNINYDIDQLRFFIRDRKKSKRTATQEVEIAPLLIYNRSELIEGKSNLRFVVCVPKFTIPDKKYFVVQLMEKNGGRHVELHVKNKNLVKALPVN